MGKSIWKACVIVLGICLLSALLLSCRKDQTTPTTSAGKSSAAKVSASQAKTTAASVGKTTATSSTGGSSEVDNETGGDGGGGQDNGNGEGDGDGDGDGDITEEVIDLKGATITLAHTHSYEAVFNSAMNTPGANIMNDFQYKKILEVQQKYNFTIHWIHTNGNATASKNALVNASMAGLFYADAMRSSSRDMLPFVANAGFIVPIDDYMDFNSPPYNYGFLYNSFYWRGRHYGVNEDGYTYNMLHSVIYNKDLTEREGMPELIYEYINGNWTWETFLDYAVRLTRDLNGDGFTDVFGTSIAGGPEFLWSNGTDILYQDHENVYFSASVDYRAIKALQFVSDLANVYKVMDTTVFGRNSVIQGRSVMCIGAGSNEGNAMITGKIRAGFVPLPRGPDATSVASYGWTSAGWVYPKGSLYTKELVTILNEAVTFWNPASADYIEQKDIVRNAMSVAGFNSETERQVYEDIIMSSQTKITFFRNYDGQLQTLFVNNVLKPILKLETTPISAIEQTRAQFEAIIRSGEVN